MHKVNIEVRYFIDTKTGKPYAMTFCEVLEPNENDWQDYLDSKPPTPALQKRLSELDTYASRKVA